MTVTLQSHGVGAPMSTDRPPACSVVEDNRDTAVLLRDLLVAEGYEVESVPTGEAALAALERTPEMDLLVLDLMLPGMSGYEVIERMRARPGLATTPILVLSALSSPSARIRGLRDGADDYMTKPFLPEELVARTRTLVTGRLLSRRTAEIQALEEIAEAALTVGDPDALLSKMVEIVVGVFDADAAAILLLDEGTPGAARARRHRARRRRPRGSPCRPDAGEAAIVLRTLAPLLIPDGASADPRVVNPAIRAGGFRSLMVAPLIVGGIADRRAGGRPARAPARCPRRPAAAHRGRPHRGHAWSTRACRPRPASWPTSCGASARAWW